MDVKIWTLKNCPNCHLVIAALQANHRVVTELSLERLVRGMEPDADALAAYAMNDNLAPLVYLADRFLNADEVRTLITKGMP